MSLLDDVAKIETRARGAVEGVGGRKPEMNGNNNNNDDLSGRKREGYS